MDDFGDKMMDFLFEVDAPEEATYELFKQAQERFPEDIQAVYDYFMIWVWSDWLGKFAPPMPEMTAEEEAAFYVRIQPLIDAAWESHAAALTTQKK